ncbi:unnamed protein product [Linum trigynum]|uniref:Reverse transcriptase domain-containing protein n=1 Tax=Linum trigynum TaxID=586398 RepID=A0AAV2D9M7_9ROSI
MELMNQLHLNIPFMEAVTQMPKYAKYLKDLLTNKKKLEGVAMVSLNEECSAVLQNQLHAKRKDPWSFTIPCFIGNMCIRKSLADLGASINVMSYKLFQKLELGELRSTMMNIQLADRCIVRPKGVLEDLLIKVGPIIYPVDFVILDIDENVKVPLILGRPLLATAKALINVHGEKLVLRAGEEEVTFSVDDSMQLSGFHDDFDYCEEVFDFMEALASAGALTSDLFEECCLVGTDITDSLENGSQPPQDQEVEALPSMPKISTSLKEPPELELKPLPPHIEYAFLRDDGKLHVIINANLTMEQKAKLIGVLRRHERAIAWKITDIRKLGRTFVHTRSIWRRVPNRFGNCKGE